MIKDPALQDRVDSMLRRGIVYSIIWLLGIGSGIAVVLGIKGIKIIRQSRGGIDGTGKAIWCIVVGGLGVSFWLFVIVMAIFNQS